MVNVINKVPIKYNDDEIRELLFCKDYELNLVRIKRRIVNVALGEYNTHDIYEFGSYSSKIYDATGLKFTEYMKHVVRHIDDIFLENYHFYQLDGDIDEFLEESLDEYNEVLSYDGKMEVVKDVFSDLSDTLDFNGGDLNICLSDIRKEISDEVIENGNYIFNPSYVTKEDGKLHHEDILGIEIVLDDETIILPLKLKIARNLLKKDILENKDKYGSQLMFNMDIDELIKKEYVMCHTALKLVSHSLDLDLNNDIDREQRIGVIDYQNSFDLSHIHENSTIDTRQSPHMRGLIRKQRLVNYERTDFSDISSYNIIPSPAINMIDGLLLNLDRNDYNYVTTSLASVDENSISRPNSNNINSKIVSFVPFNWEINKMKKLIQLVDIDEDTHNITFSFEVDEHENGAFYDYVSHGLIGKDIFNKIYVSPYEIVRDIREFNLGLIKLKDNDKPFIHVDVNKVNQKMLNNNKLIQQLAFVGRNDVLPVNFLSLEVRYDKELFNEHVNNEIYNVDKRFLKNDNDTQKINQMKQKMINKYENSQPHVSKEIAYNDVGDEKYTSVFGTNENILKYIYNGDIHKDYNKNNKVKIEIDYMENDLIHVLVYEYMLSPNHYTGSIVHLFSEHDDFTRRFDFYKGEYFKTFSENYFKPMRYRLNSHEDLSKYGFDKSYTISKFKEYGMNFDVPTSEKVDLELLDEINELYTDEETRFEIMRDSDVLLFTNFMTFVYPNGVYNFDDFLSYKHLVQAHENIISKCFYYSGDSHKTRKAIMYLFNCDDLTHFKENLMITRNNRQHGAFGLGMLNFRLKLSSDSFDKRNKQKLLLGTHSIKEYLESL